MDLPGWAKHETQEDIRALLALHRYRWLVTGAAGFIGSNLVESLLRLGQEVRGLDNFATGHRRNLDDVRAKVGEVNWSRFRFIEGDIRSPSTCEEAIHSIDYVLHQAALGSVPRSVEDPLPSHDTNVSGFIYMLDAARRSNVRRFVYAASSSTYGDEPHLPKREDRIGNPLSPYAATKLIDEIYAAVYFRTFGFASAGLRYFNVFGPRQDPSGAYAAVIPKWVGAMLANREVTIHGDGETSRDFCFVDNVVQANVRAALFSDGQSSEVYNVAVGDRTSLNELYLIIRDGLVDLGHAHCGAPNYSPFRAGDVRHSLADVSKAQARLSYRPLYDLRAGMAKALPWYVDLFTSVATEQGAL